MNGLEYLPFEGLKSSHEKYRRIKLHLAAEALERGDKAAAKAFVNQAGLWPERLGAGKPYDELLDSSVEEWLHSKIDTYTGGKITEELERRL